ncbi:OLC1v1013359C1 [Oldenlandia corymbosa var. corymbosa]|uniref:OLC1v1013359C1 n=1 Tax=Oldenlandia corymbosa var. corymbosa TaxID=529605 RepID=A0AAV1E1I6_OLDCO|nr:OLC1v1013359C1 [Oldenlandia corymbosa var. corymbosa]
MLFIIIFALLFFIPSLIAFDPYTIYTQLNLPSGVLGPDSVTLDRFRGGPYVAVNDGRVLKYDGSNFQDFAFTSPNRSKNLCDGTKDLNLGPKCGRPFGFSFNTITGVLYIVDAYLGLFKVGPNGGQATLLANSANGVPFKFLTGIDVDIPTGLVYFTDASTTYSLKDALEGKFPPSDSTGRLLQYDPITRQVKELLKGVPAPVGPAVSIDSSFVIFSQFYAQKVVKYWLMGPRTGATDILLNLPGNPVKVKRAEKPGEFWVPVNHNFLPSGYKFNSRGDILLVKDLSKQFVNARVDVIQEYEEVIIYVGSVEANFVGVFSGW